MKRFLILAVMLTSCDDDSDAAPGKCETFVASLCGRAADCWSAIDPSLPRTELLADCQSSAKTAIDCGAAVGVSDSFDRCLRDLTTATCASVTADPPQLPQSCKGAILLPE